MLLKSYHIVSDFIKIDSIFIIGAETIEYEHLINVYPKIIGIYTNLDVLCTSVQEEIDFINKQLLTFSFFNRNQISTGYISKESAEFLWFQLFSYVLSHLSHNQQTNEQMIHMCNELKQAYRSEEAIRWYLKTTVISKLLIEALRKQDIEQLYKIRFFIDDLTENLAYEHQKILFENEQTLTVYRGTKLTERELKKLKAIKIYLSV